ncbi:MAG: hypothetical protein ACRC2T_10795 [Thermoguttaceae bacterium]
MQDKKLREALAKAGIIKYFLYPNENIHAAELVSSVNAILKYLDIELRRHPDFGITNKEMTVVKIHRPEIDITSKIKTTNGLVNDILEEFEQQKPFFTTVKNIETLANDMNNVAKTSSYPEAITGALSYWADRLLVYASRLK